MSDQLTLSAETRDRGGKGASRHLRREGRIPAVIYGDKKDPISGKTAKTAAGCFDETGYFAIWEYA